MACVVFSDACFATTFKDVQIGLRVVDFLVNPPLQQSSVAIIFDSHSRESREDAENMMTWLSSGVGGAKTSLSPVLVDVRDLGGTRGIRVGFVATATESGYDAILEFARRNGALIISAELSCVRNAKCTVGVASAPRVEVIVNREVALESGVNFTEAFRMMVTEY
jgi:hypothetical protein